MLHNLKQNLHSQNIPYQSHTMLITLQAKSGKQHPKNLFSGFGAVSKNGLFLASSINVGNIASVVLEESDITYAKAKPSIVRAYLGM